VIRADDEAVDQFMRDYMSLLKIHDAIPSYEASLITDNQLTTIAFSAP
jgi:hypothetical protein